MRNKEAWDECMQRQADKLWTDVITEVETSNLHAALSGTLPRKFSRTHFGAVRGSSQKGFEKAEATLQSEVQRKGNDDYHGASKAKEPNSRRVGNTIIRKRRTNQ